MAIFSAIDLYTSSIDYGGGNVRYNWQRRCQPKCWRSHLRWLRWNNRTNWGNSWHSWHLWLFITCVYQTFFIYIKLNLFLKCIDKRCSYLIADCDYVSQEIFWSAGSIAMWASSRGMGGWRRLIFDYHDGLEINIYMHKFHFDWKCNMENKTILLLHLNNIAIIMLAIDFVFR